MGVSILCVFLCVSTCMGHVVMDDTVLHPANLPSPLRGHVRPDPQTTHTHTHAHTHTRTRTHLLSYVIISPCVPPLSLPPPGLQERQKYLGRTESIRHTPIKTPGLCFKAGSPRTQIYSEYIMYIHLQIYSLCIEKDRAS